MLSILRYLTVGRALVPSPFASHEGERSSVKQVKGEINKERLAHHARAANPASEAAKTKSLDEMGQRGLGKAEEMGRRDRPRRRRGLGELGDWTGGDAWEARASNGRTPKQTRESWRGG